MGSPLTEIGLLRIVLNRFLMVQKNLTSLNNFLIDESFSARIKAAWSLRASLSVGVGYGMTPLSFICEAIATALAKSRGSSLYQKNSCLRSFIFLQSKTSIQFSSLIFFQNFCGILWGNGERDGRSTFICDALSDWIREDKLFYPQETKNSRRSLHHMFVPDVQHHEVTRHLKFKFVIPIWTLKELPSLAALPDSHYRHFRE